MGGERPGPRCGSGWGRPVLAAGDDVERPALPVGVVETGLAGADSRPP